MPFFSTIRNAQLLTIEECADLFRRHRNSVDKRLKALAAQGTPAYSEDLKEGRTSRRLYDPATLGWPLPATLHTCEASADDSHPRFTPAPTLHTPEKLSSGTLNMPDSGDLAKIDASHPGGVKRQVNPLDLVLAKRPTEQELYQDIDEAGKARHRELLPILTTPKNSPERGRAVKQYAAAKGLTVQAVRWQVRQVETNGLAALKKRQRRDAGGYHISQLSMQVIVSAWLSNPATTSGRLLQRTLIRAVPEAMRVVRADGGQHWITASTVIRIRRDLEANPLTRLLFTNADDQKEYLRTYSGEVVALYANQLWQQDMTRCDIWVLDPETEKIYRPRVQAIIDVYSGCIMSVAFSPDEDQVQADLAFIRALSRKAGPLADKYPMYGRPERLYIDNGKTYSSEHFHRICAELGIQLIHSMPRVSHTRGKIERFFGTLHGLEKALPGYSGENAVTAAKEELRKLRTATERWVETGRDPGQGQRLLTIQEYQNAVLAWLIVDYHQTVVDGHTRMQHFVDTAPAASLLEFDPTELLLLFAARVERVVRPDGTVSIDNTLWTLTDGTLGTYRGLKVMVLHDRFALDEHTHAIVWREKNGQLRLLGQAVPAPTVAGSIEAADQRRATKAAKQELLREANTLKADIRDPGLTVSAALQKELTIVPVQPIAPAARGRIEAVNPVRPDLGDWGREFDGDDLGDTLADVMKRLSEGNQ